MKQLLINMMAELYGYYYDSDASTDEYIKFNYPCMVFPLVFDSWHEVEEWIKEID